VTLPMRWREAAALLIALQIALFALIEPRGEFPLNDDWAYAQSVLWLLAEHRVRLSDWIAMNLLPQTIVGGATATLFGFSFSTLRHLTQAIALLGSLGMLWVFRAAGLTPTQAALAAIATVITPWWLELANSYMSDVYAFALALPAAALYLRALASSRPGPLLAAATALSVLGVLQRQVVLVLPLAFGCAWMLARAAASWRAGHSFRSWVSAVAPLAACALAIALYKVYLVSGPGVPAAQQLIEGRLLPMLGRLLVGDPFYWLWSGKLVSWLGGFIGLVVAGYAIVLLGRGGGSRRQRLVVLVVALALSACVLIGLWMPPYRSGQLITATGIGPYSLFDVLGRFEREVPTPAPHLFWSAYGIAAAVGASVFLVAVATVIRRCWAERGADGRRIFLLVSVIAYLLPFAITDFVDRYLLFVLPFILLLVHDAFGAPRQARQRGITVVGAALMVALAVLSAAGAHDYFAWNRSRWAAINEAIHRGATPETLDGGFEYNGFHRFETTPRIAVPDKSWWWVKDDRYCVSFEPRTGYRLLQSWNVRAWLPTTPGKVLLLERVGDNATSERAQ
jgi:hypothetical protein